MEFFLGLEEPANKAIHIQEKTGAVLGAIMRGINSENRGNRLTASRILKK
jgi:hypothetical protein